jgi:hypothetical protein
LSSISVFRHSRLIPFLHRAVQLLLSPTASRGSRDRECLQNMVKLFREVKARRDLHDDFDGLPYRLCPWSEWPFVSRSVCNEKK